MRAGEHHAVAAEQLDAFALEIVVGGDVVREALGVQPLDEVEVGGELPDRAGAVARLRPHRQDRTAPGREADPAAVGVMIVRRQPELGVRHQMEVVRVEHRRVTDDRLPDRHLGDDVVVGVREVAGRRHEEEDLRRRPARRRQHEERHVAPPTLRGGARTA